MAVARPSHYDPHLVHGHVREAEEGGGDAPHENLAIMPAQQLALEPVAPYAAQGLPAQIQNLVNGALGASQLGPGLGRGRPKPLVRGLRRRAGVPHVHAQQQLRRLHLQKSCSSCNGVLDRMRAWGGPAPVSAMPKA